MKREILFRGWSEIDSRWNFGHFVGYCTPIIYDLNKRFPFQVNPDTVGQYTGLTDKNGEKIFEGDIIQVGEKVKKEVCFIPSKGAFQCANLTDNQFEDCWDIYQDFPKSERMQVIGNIHEK